MDKLAVAGVDTDVADAVAGTKENKVAGKKLVPRDVFGCGALIARGTRD